MHGIDKLKKKKTETRTDVRSRARRAPTTSESRRRTWRDFMPAKICRVIDSNMAVTSCKLSCYTVRRCRPLETRWNDHDQIGRAGRLAGGQAGRRAGRQVSSRQVVVGTTGWGKRSRAGSTGRCSRGVRKRFETCGAAHGTFVKNRVITLI